MTITRTLLILLAALSCSSSGPKTYAPYQGEPVFPSKQEPLNLGSGTFAFVSNSYSDSIDVVDLDTGKRIRSVPVGRNPVDIDGPHHLAIDVASNSVYTALSYPVLTLEGPHLEHGTSQKLGYLQRLSLLDLSVMAEVRIETNPGDVVVSEDGHRVVVSHFDLERARSRSESQNQNADLVYLRTDTFRADAAYTDPTRLELCRAPHAIALSKPDGKDAYVTCFADDALAIAHLDEKRVELIPLGAAGTSTGQIGPYALSQKPGTDIVAIANTESKSLMFFDLKARALVIPAIATMGAPYFPAWSPDGSELFVPVQLPDSLRVLDGKTGDTLRQRTFTKDVCERPHEVTLLDATRMGIVCEGDRKSPGAILILDRQTLEQKSRTLVGLYPDRMAIVRKP
jgi:YVTN family beta-propeller protein